ncbi:VacB/RNase II family 3'-5' exoribonuclease [Pseudomaricurvus sp. HS19]|uniref:VacB/RNase II family 3'-5' exoribonuclease n=1 Tax=Pseudomaricurvus sp. HS19 TaxID=2692626 RepID=UPI00136C672F|nr:VacB/RNase II family 3'-5' exoribonuclease [Pseudomaricurvus sp. HS19]MYM62775.1 VacB/RNase II family 3'-5' exoribonuclease [Pseudomaricurvus sp. HS19]
MIPDYPVSPMLDANALSQLTQLKQNIRADKNLATGTIRGSQGRFGFVTLDDGRDIFLPPDEMARVLPGDRVEVALGDSGESNGEGENRKLQAELDKLLDSPQKVVVGQYLIRGKGHFVAVDMPQLNRWIFLPPKARSNAKEGDYLLCRITRHPFEDGKGQAKVTEVLGSPGEAGIEHKVTCRKYQLKGEWSKEQLQQVKEIQARSLQQLPDYAGRAQLQQLPFVTIDSATTMDMDDALCVERRGDGWQLTVAIADPSSTIAPGTALDKVALKRANTAYLPGRAISMLPQELSHNTYSLVPGEERPALVCHMQVESDGRISDTRFEFGLIRSHHKLSYLGVADWLQNDNTDAVPAECQPMLRELAECSHALNRYRAEHLLLMEERDDYYLQLDDKWHISAIRRDQRNLAQQIVEEAMLATNRCAGDLLAQHPGHGLFSGHGGFRPERLESIKAILQQELPQLAELDLATLDGYRQLIRQLQQNADTAGLLAAFRLMLQASELTTEALPHMGLGMDYYATVTSPIRRYNDLHNHRALRAILEQSSGEALNAEQLGTLQQGASSARQASRDLEQWLHCLFLQQQPAATWAGRVSRVTSQGVSVVLTDWGINGFVKLDPKAYQFDQDRMTLSSDEGGFVLNQEVQVTLERVDLDKKRINFALVVTEG